MDEKDITIKYGDSRFTGDERIKGYLTSETDSQTLTWDGNTGTVYVDEPVDSFAKSGHIVKSLQQLKFGIQISYQEKHLSFCK